VIEGEAEGAQMSTNMAPHPGIPLAQALGQEDEFKFVYPQFPEGLPHAPRAYLAMYIFAGEYYVLDVGRADDVRQTILEHPHWGCWESIARTFGTLSFAIEQAPMSADMQEQLAQRVRARCGQLPCD